MSFKEYKLGEIYTISSGLSKSRAEFGFGYPFLTFKDVFNNFFIPDKLESLANTSDKERSNCSIKRGDVFLTRTSETVNELGMSSVALKDYADATFNGFTKRLRPKTDRIVLPEYVGFYFRSKMFREQVNSMSVMTTRASLNNSMIEKLTIRLPDIEEQLRTANLLLSITEKIEVNNQINKTLESMGQSIFKHWFGDFEFPNENGEPYKSSGGEMVESELGMIPKGWQVNSIGDYVKVKSGFAFKSAWWKDEGVPVVKIKSLQNNTINFNDVGYVESDKVDKAKEFRVIAGDLLIAMTGATIGKLGLVPTYNKPILVNQRVGKFFLGDEPINRIGFLYCLVNQKNIYEQIVLRGDGSAQPNISPSRIESIKIVLPPKEHIDLMNALLKRKFELIVRNLRENMLLSQLRDTILPKLMSGEIRVPVGQ